MSMYETLKARQSELRGKLADPGAVERLRDLLGLREMPDLLRAFAELPVCGMTVAFRIEDGELSAEAERYAPVERDDFDTNYDNEFDWMTPHMIVDEIEQAWAGPAVFEAGFLPFGMRTIGGDGYFLQIKSDGANSNPLLEVYYDWVDPHDVARAQEWETDFVAVS